MEGSSARLLHYLVVCMCQFVLQISIRSGSFSMIMLRGGFSAKFLSFLLFLLCALYAFNFLP